MRKQTKIEDYLHQTRSRYNRKSGEKTLAFVGVLIFIVAILSILTIILL